MNNILKAKIAEHIVFGTVMTVVLAASGRAAAAQFTVNPANITIEVRIDSRELNGSANSFPKRAEWHSSILKLLNSATLSTCIIRPRRWACLTFARHTGEMP